MALNRQQCLEQLGLSEAHWWPFSFSRNHKLYVVSCTKVSVHSHLILARLLEYSSSFPSCIILASSSSLLDLILGYRI